MSSDREEIEFPIGSVWKNKCSFINWMVTHISTLGVHIHKVVLDDKKEWKKVQGGPYGFDSRESLRKYYSEVPIL